MEEVRPTLVLYGLRAGVNTHFNVDVRRLLFCHRKQKSPNAVWRGDPLGNEADGTALVSTLPQDCLDAHKSSSIFTKGQMIAMQKDYPCTLFGALGDVPAADDR